MKNLGSGDKPPGAVASAPAGTSCRTLGKSPPLHSTEIALKFLMAYLLSYPIASFQLSSYLISPKTITLWAIPYSKFPPSLAPGTLFSPGSHSYYSSPPFSIPFMSSFSVTHPFCYGSPVFIPLCLSSHSFPLPS